MKPTPKQDAVINSKGNVILVYGGPGSGKTTTALWAAQHAVANSNNVWERALFLTFSRTAVTQIAKRAPAILAETRGRIEIATFHGFAWKLIASFGRYAGLGTNIPRLQSEARAKLLGADGARLRYDDLVPQALAMLQSTKVHRLLTTRYARIISDEFQDTDNEQWELLRRLSKGRKLVLLADSKQMIYSGFLRHRGVSKKRLATAELVADDIIELEARSHRDPSGTIPAMAAAIRDRDFMHEAVEHATQTGRLRVCPKVSAEDLGQVLLDEIESLRSNGAKSIGVFAHSNRSVTYLSDGFAKVNLDHVIIGLPEAHTEALSTMLDLCGIALGTVSDEEAKTSLAVFLTACIRAKEAPPLAVQLASGAPLPPVLEQRLQNLFEGLRATEGALADLLEAVGATWPSLGIAHGTRIWPYAVRDLRRLALRLLEQPIAPETLERLRTAIEERLPARMLEAEITGRSPIHLMNFHQTKGREADGVILVYQTGDYLANARDGEPYTESSRVLYVALTRARERITVLLPPDPHPLIAPFLQLHQ